MAKAKPSPGPVTTLVVGEPYFFRTCRYDYVGRLVSIDGPYSVTITDAAWVSETGRFAEFVREGRAAGMEVEPLPDGRHVGLQWVDWSHWPHALLREVV